MAGSGLPTMVCPSCGRKGRWRPEFAGRRIKCPCGHAMTAPEEALHPAAVAGESLPGSGRALRPARPAAPAAPSPKRPETVAALEPPTEPEAVESEDGGGTSPVEAEADDTGLYDIVEDNYPARPVRPPAAEGDDTPAAAPVVAAAIPTPFKRPPAAPKEELDDRVKKWLILGGPVLLVVVTAAVIGIRLLTGGGSAATAAAQKGEDADVEVMIRDQYGKEIHDWMQENPTRLVQGMTPSQAISQADLWRRWGAKRVMAFGAVMTTALAIELPDDPAQRKTLFDWQAQWHSEMRMKVWTDEGQKWLLIRMKP